MYHDHHSSSQLSLPFIIITSIMITIHHPNYHYHSSSSPCIMITIHHHNYHYHSSSSSQLSSPFIITITSIMITIMIHHHNYHFYSSSPSLVSSPFIITIRHNFQYHLHLLSSSPPLNIIVCLCSTVILIFKLYITFYYKKCQVQTI